MKLAIIAIAGINAVCAVLVYGLDLAEMQHLFPSIRDSSDVKHAALIGVLYGGLLGPLGLLLFWLMFGDYGLQWKSLPPESRR